MPWDTSYMKWILTFLILSFSTMTLAFEGQNAATGFEVGVARISDGDNALIGPSWTYHFEYQPDTLLAFFGQAGSAWAEEDDRKFRQTHFGGGLKFHLLPVFYLQVGVASTLAYIKEKQQSEKKYQEMGPLVGATMLIPVGVFRLGTTATIIRTDKLQTTALRMALLIEI